MLSFVVAEKEPKEGKPEWRDKYYRDESAK
jgi:hypothetical protein